MRGRCKAQPKPLHTGALWRNGDVYTHKGIQVRCALVQDGRYWVARKYLHRSPDQAMDRIEGRPV